MGGRIGNIKGEGHKNLGADAELLLYECETVPSNERTRERTVSVAGGKPGSDKEPSGTGDPHLFQKWWNRTVEPTVRLYFRGSDLFFVRFLGSRNSSENNNSEMIMRHKWVGPRISPQRPEKDGEHGLLRHLHRLGPLGNNNSAKRDRERERWVVGS